MPLATPAEYAEMLDAAKACGCDPRLHHRRSDGIVHDDAERRDPRLHHRRSDGIVHDEIAEAVSYGVVKMNLNRDAQACRQLGSEGRSLTPSHAPRPRRV